MSTIRNHRAVCASRIEPPDSADFFPTPPWGGRALVEHVIGRRGLREMTVLEPACGEGHLAYALADYFGTVVASDLHSYGYGAVRDFLDPAADVGMVPDWIITNPPFGQKAIDFARRALAIARVGVAMLVPSRYLEGKRRFRTVYKPTPPATIAHFVERLPIHRGRWVPDGDTAMSYCWIVWRLDRPVRATPTVWIPPCRDRLLLRRDVERFGEAA